MLATRMLQKNTQIRKHCVNGMAWRDMTRSPLILLVLIIPLMLLGLASLSYAPHPSHASSLSSLSLILLLLLLDDSIAFCAMPQNRERPCHQMLLQVNPQSSRAQPASKSGAPNRQPHERRPHRRQPHWKQPHRRTKQRKCCDPQYHRSSHRLQGGRHAPQ